MDKTRVSAGTRMMGAAVALGFFMGMGAGGAAAQQRLQIEGQGGVSMPTGDFGTVTDAGPNFGMLVGYLLSPRVAINVDGNVDLLNGAELAGGAQAPDMRQWRYGLGVAADFLPSERWALVGNVGAGASRLTSDEFASGGSTGQQKYAHTYFSSNVGLKLGYALSRNVTTYVGGRTVMTLANEDDSQVLADLDPGVLQPFGTAWSVPVTVGMDVKLGGGRQTRVASTPAARPAPTRTEGPSREELASRLCDQATAAMEAGDYARARELLQRALSDYAGTTCAAAAPALLEEVRRMEILAERVHFDFNRWEITDASAAVLQRKAEVLRSAPGMLITIEGHCDERGSLEYNQALGMRRAQAASQYLISLGIPETTFRMVSFGEERPLVARSDETSWRQNRRAEFVVRKIATS